MGITGRVIDVSQGIRFLVRSGRPASYCLRDPSSFCELCEIDRGLIAAFYFDVDLSVEERSTGWLLIASEVCCSNDFLNV